MKVRIDKYHIKDAYTLMSNRANHCKVINVPKSKVKEWNKISDDFEWMQLEMEKYYNE